MKLIVTALAVAAGNLATPAHAAEAAMTAGDLQELCAGSDHVSRNVCRIYILGVTEGIAQGMSIARGAVGKACIPEGVSAEQLEETVEARLGKDLSSSPAQRSAAAAPVLARMLAEAFPCPGPSAAQH